MMELTNKSEDGIGKQTSVQLGQAGSLKYSVSAKRQKGLTSSCLYICSSIQQY